VAPKPGEVIVAETLGKRADVPEMVIHLITVKPPQVCVPFGRWRTDRALALIPQNEQVRSLSSEALDISGFSVIE
jgi:hypothetical protein